jgi:hypothetical protein
MINAEFNRDDRSSISATVIGGWNYLISQLIPNQIQLKVKVKISFKFLL